MFLKDALRFDLEGMAAAILAIKPVAPWAPKFVVLHNTAAPSLKDWLGYSQAQKESWGNNLNAYYRRMGWHAGPHFAATPETWSYVLCDLNADGVHASCFNRVAYGIEMVGDFRPGGDDPTSSAGRAVAASAINMLAALHVRFGWDPADYEYGVKGLHFHEECKADDHACPGSLISKPAIIELVKARMSRLGVSSIAKAAPLAASTLPPAATPMPPTIIIPAWPPTGDPFFALGARVFNMWKKLGYTNESALAMLAQAEAETSLNIKARGDHDGAYGLHQWHSPRAAQIKAGTGIDVMTDPLIENHVKAADWELNHTYRTALMHIEGATTARDAGIAACVFYEGAGAPLAAERRGAMSERWAILFSSPEGVALLKANPARG